MQPLYTQPLIHPAPLHLLLSFPQCTPNHCTPKCAPSSPCPVPQTAVTSFCIQTPELPCPSPLSCAHAVLVPVLWGDWVTLTSGKGQHLAEPQGSVLGTAAGTGLQQQELTAREGSMQGHSCPWQAPCALNAEGEEVKKGKEDEDGEEDEEGASSRFKSWRRQAGNSSHPCFLHSRWFLSFVFGGD